MKAPKLVVVTPLKPIAAKMAKQGAVLVLKVLAVVRPRLPAAEFPPLLAARVQKGFPLHVPRPVEEQLLSKEQLKLKRKSNRWILLFLGKALVYRAFSFLSTDAIRPPNSQMAKRKDAAKMIIATIAYSIADPLSSSDVLEYYLFLNTYPFCIQHFYQFFLREKTFMTEEFLPFCIQEHLRRNCIYLEFC